MKIMITDDEGTLFSEINVVPGLPMLENYNGRVERAIIRRLEESPFRLLQCDNCARMIPRDQMPEEPNDEGYFFCYICTPKERVNK